MKKFFTLKTLKISAICAFVLLLVITAGFFIDSFAPANPKCYHKWVLSTFNGSYDKKGCPKTFWKPEQLVDEEKGVRAISYIVAETTVTNNEGINEIWLNLSDFKEATTTIFIRQGEGGSGKEIKQFTLNAKDLKASSDGWIKIYDVDDGDKKYEGTSYNKKFSIGFVTNIKVREMGFVGNLDMGVKFSDVYMMLGTDKFDDKKTCENLTDEQSTFPYLVNEEE